MLLSSNEVQNNDTNKTWPEIEGNCCAILDESKRKVRETPTQHTKKTRHKVMWSWSTQTNRGTYLKLGVIIHQNRNNSYIRHESAKEHVIFSLKTDQTTRSLYFYVEVFTLLLDRRHQSVEATLVRERTNLGRQLSYCHLSSKILQCHSLCNM